MSSKPTRSTGIVLVSFAALAVYLLFGNLPMDDRHNHDFMSRVMDAGHFPLFLGLSLALMFAAGFPAGKTLAMLAGFAGAVEILQPQFDRSESLTDLLNGLTGILFGAVSFFLRERSAAKSRQFLWAASSLAVFSMMLIPAYWEWQSIAWRAKHFPFLGGFEEDEELRLWQATRSDISLSRSGTQASEGKFSLHVVSENDRPPAARYLAGDLDWSTFGAFSADIFSSRDQVGLHVRIDDSHDCTETESRFNDTVELHRGWNHIELPIARIENKGKMRKLDMTKIRQVIFFADAGPKTAFYFDNLRLISHSARSPH